MMDGYVSDVPSQFSTNAPSEISQDLVESSRTLEKQFKVKYNYLRDAYETRITQMTASLEDRHRSASEEMGQQMVGQQHSHRHEMGQQQNSHLQERQQQQQRERQLASRLELVLRERDEGQKRYGALRESFEARGRHVDVLEDALHAAGNMGTAEQHQALRRDARELEGAAQRAKQLMAENQILRDRATAAQAEAFKCGARMRQRETEVEGNRARVDALAAQVEGILAEETEQSDMTIRALQEGLRATTERAALEVQRERNLGVLLRKDLEGQKTLREEAAKELQSKRAAEAQLREELVKQKLLCLALERKLQEREKVLANAATPLRSAAPLTPQPATQQDNGISNARREILREQQEELQRARVDLQAEREQFAALKAADLRAEEVRLGYDSDIVALMKQLPSMQEQALEQHEERLRQGWLERERERERNLKELYGAAQAESAQLRLQLTTAAEIIERLKGIVVQGQEAIRKLTQAQEQQQQGADLTPAGAHVQMQAQIQADGVGVPEILGASGASEMNTASGASGAAASAVGTVGTVGDLETAGTAETVLLDELRVDNDYLRSQLRATEEASAAAERDAREVGTLRGRVARLEAERDGLSHDVQQLQQKALRISAELASAPSPISPPSAVSVYSSAAGSKYRSGPESGAGAGAGPGPGTESTYELEAERAICGQLRKDKAILQRVLQHAAQLYRAETQLLRSDLADIRTALASLSAQPGGQRSRVEAQCGAVFAQARAGAEHQLAAHIRQTNTHAVEVDVLERKLDKLRVQAVQHTIEAEALLRGKAGLSEQVATLTLALDQASAEVRHLSAALADANEAEMETEVESGAEARRGSEWEGGTAGRMKERKRGNRVCFADDPRSQRSGGSASSAGGGARSSSSGGKDSRRRPIFTRPAHRTGSRSASGSTSQAATGSGSGRDGGGGSSVGDDFIPGARPAVASVLQGVLEALAAAALVDAAAAGQIQSLAQMHTEPSPGAQAAARSIIAARLALKSV